MIRCSWRMVPCFCLWVVIVQLVSACFAQDPPTSSGSTDASSGPSLLSIRRVFIPQSELNAKLKENFSQVEAQLLSKAIDALRDTELVSQEYGSIDQELSLASMHYVAGLIGPDLVSDRSRLRLSRGSMSGERFALRPWSLALEDSIANNYDSNPLWQADDPLARIWTFESDGCPLVPAPPIRWMDLVRAKQDAGTSAATAKRLRNPNLDQWFSWTMRSKKESGPKRLLFAMEIPPCVDSLMVLRLPPLANVVDCTTVASRIESAATLKARLGDWPDPVAPIDAVGGAQRNESLWLIELSGASKVAFSISLGGPSDLQLFETMVRSQQIEHVLETHGIKTTCDFEIPFSDAVQPTLRVPVPNGTRVRRIQVNQQELTDWQLNDSTIEFQLPWSTIKPTTNEEALERIQRLSTEWFTPYPQDRTDPQSIAQVLPVIAIEGSYVFQGSTAIATNTKNATSSESPWQLSHVAVRPDPSNAYATLPTTNNGSEFHWNGRAPAIEVAAIKNPGELRAEVMSRLIDDDQRFLAVVRAQFKAADRDCFDAEILIQPEWTLQSIQGTTSADTTSIQKQSMPGQTKVSVHWDKSLKNRTSELELQLVRESDSINQQRSLNAGPILELPGWKRSDTLVLEGSRSARLRYTPAIIENLITEDALPKWQRDRLPRLSQFTFLSLKSGRIPELLWNEDSRTISSDVETWITHPAESGSRSVFVRHRLDISAGARLEPFVIRMPNVPAQWRTLNGGEWQTLNAVRTDAPQQSEQASSSATEHRDAPEGYWQLPSNPSKPIYQFEVSYRWNLDADSKTELPLPSLVGSTTGKSKVHIARDIDVLSVEGEPRWEIDESGNPELQLQSVGSRTLRIATRPPIASSANPLMVLDQSLDVAVDLFGNQVALVGIRCSLPSDPSANLPNFEYELPAGWQPEFVGRLNAQGTAAGIAYEKHATKLILPAIALAQAIHDEKLRGTHTSYFQILLRGPRLNPVSKTSQALENRNYLDRLFFRWPQGTSSWPVAQSSARLWLPTNLTIRSIDLPVSNSESDWEPWSWWQNAVTALADPPAAWKTTLALKKGPPAFLLSQAFDKEYSLAREVTGIQAIQSQFIELESARRTQLSSMFLLLILPIVLPVFLQRYRRTALVGTCALVIGAHLLPPAYAFFCQAVLLGTSIGFVVLVLAAMVRFVRHDREPSQRAPSKWIPWNESRSQAPNLLEAPNHTATMPSLHAMTSGFVLWLAYCLTCILIVVGFFSLRSPLFAQDLGGSSPARTTFDVVIPTDDQGKMVGSVVYVPNTLASALNGRSDANARTEKESRPISARHTLKLDDRSRTLNSNDPINFSLSYEYWIGDASQSIRFPWNSDSRLIRFQVDGFDIPLGSQLRREESSLTWTPTRSGRHSVQMMVQARSKALEQPAVPAADLRIDGSTNPNFSIDLGILPVANAVLDIDADSLYSIDVTANGRVTNAAIGKSKIRLGPVERIQCAVRRSNALSNSGLSGTSGSTITAADIPTVNTELLLRGDSLHARTIVEFPKSVELGRETIEMEADLSWQPIGRIWGDAQLIEVRPGSTGSRKRYVLEWLPTALNSAPKSRDRRLITMWVPQSNQNILNVLFAECRDPRVRPGSLRYAREAGSAWLIDGISSWIPTINPRDRLDWPEVKGKTLPIATQVRIPSSGGFGILRRQMLITNSQPERVRSQWTLGVDTSKLVLRSELSAKSISTGTFELELPGNFTVNEVLFGKSPMPFFQQRDGDKRRVQIFLDRNSLDISVLALTATGDVPTDSSQTKSTPWREAPSVVLPASASVEQSLEVFADPSVVCLLEEYDPNNADASYRYVTGLGEQALIASFAWRESASSPKIQLPRFRTELRNQSTSGIAMLELPSRLPGDMGSAMLQLKMMRSGHTQRMCFADVPSIFSERWQSDVGVSLHRPIPSPNRLWLDLGGGQRTGPLSEIDRPTEETIHVQFHLDSIATIEKLVEMELIHDGDLPLYIASDDVMDIRKLREWKNEGERNRLSFRELPTEDPQHLRLLEQFQLGSNSVIFRKETGSPMIEPPSKAKEEPSTDTTYRFSRLVRPMEYSVGSALDPACIETRLWVVPNVNDPSLRRKAKWALDSSATVDAVQCNGVWIPFRQENDMWECSIEHSGLPYELAIYSSHRGDRLGTNWSADKEFLFLKEHAPRWDGRLDETWWIASDGQCESSNPDHRYPTSDATAPQHIQSMCLNIVEQTLRAHTVNKPKSDSAWANWIPFWDQQMMARMLDWRHRIDASPANASELELYGTALLHWTQLRSPWIALSSPPSELDYAVKQNLWFPQPNRWNPISVSRDPAPASRSWSTIGLRIGWKDIGSIAMCLALVALVWIAYVQIGETLMRRPWWCLTSLALFTWLFSGWGLPMLFLQSIAAIAAIDGWLMVNAPFRRTGIRGLRSL